MDKLEATDTSRELACRLGADLIEALHVAAQDAAGEALRVGALRAPTLAPFTARLGRAVRACDALVRELVAGRIELRPTVTRRDPPVAIVVTDLDAQSIHRSSEGGNPGSACDDGCGFCGRCT